VTTSILVESPEFIVKPTPQKVKQGETAIFETKIDGYPTPKITWHLNRKPLTPNNGAQIAFNATTGVAKILIPKVDWQQHTGQVTCRLENPHGCQEEKVELYVVVAPSITTQLPKQEETVSGQDITLRIVVHGIPRPNAQWLFKERPIGTESVTFDEEKSEYQLLIKNPTVAMSEGAYRVLLENEVGETESTPCVLTVLEPVRLTKIVPTTDVINLKVGEPFEISVDVTGKEKPKVQLAKDGKEMKFTKVEGTRYTFSVAIVSPHDRGSYKVTATNKISTEQSDVMVRVTGKFLVVRAFLKEDDGCLLQIHFNSMVLMKNFTVNMSLIACEVLNDGYHVVILTAVFFFRVNRISSSIEHCIESSLCAFKCEPEIRFEKQHSTNILEIAICCRQYAEFSVIEI
jgi:hypothetical protein